MKIIAAAVLLFNIAYARADCGPGWQLRSGTNFCYRFEQTVANWTDASSACVSFGGNLVTISDSAEKNYVSALIQSETRPVWTGLTDELGEGVWRWADDSCITFTSWNPIDWMTSEPSYNEGGKECVTILPDSKNWNDDGCAYTYPFVCRKKLVGQGQVTLNTVCETACKADWSDNYVGYIYENGVCTCQYRWFQFSGNADTYYVVCAVHEFPPTTTESQTEAPTTTTTPDAPTTTATPDAPTTTAAPDAPSTTAAPDATTAQTTQDLPETTRRHHKCKKHG
ncbi:C-type mannose receptor 2-like [Physella acuta]|uniref:C-type mannose receptor 2-like n=1 Tax=Physella acuta TaxID=109671 RepID=UPI0027DE7A7F|nr:C-type mannose receptor 2-like [Physella acuta]